MKDGPGYPMAAGSRGAPAPTCSSGRLNVPTNTLEEWKRESSKWLAGLFFVILVLHHSILVMWHENHSKWYFYPFLCYVVAKIADWNCQHAPLITIMLFHWHKCLYTLTQTIYFRAFNDATPLTFTAMETSLIQPQMRGSDSKGICKEKWDMLKAGSWWRVWTETTHASGRCGYADGAPSLVQVTFSWQQQRTTSHTSQTCCT